MLNYQRVHLVHAFSLPRHSLRLKRVQCSLAWVDLGAWAWFVGKSSIKIWALHQTIEKKTCGKRCFNQWTMVILPSKIRVSPVKIEKTKTYSNHQQFKCSYQSHDRWECNHWKGGEILDLWLYDFYHTCLFNYFTGKGLGVMVENSL